MGKFKKTVSAFASAAVAASVFSAFAVPASANVTKYSNDWEAAEATGFSDAGRSGSSLVTDFEGNMGTCVEMHNSGGAKGTQKMEIGTVSANKVYIEFDIYFTNEAGSKYVAVGSGLGRMGTDSYNDIATETGIALALQNYTGGTVYVNETNTGIAAKQWLKVSAVADFSTKKVAVTITPKVGAPYSSTVAFMDSTIENINSITLNRYTNPTTPALYLDNLSVSVPELEYKDGSVRANIAGTVIVASYSGDHMTGARTYDVAADTTTDIGAADGDKIMFWDGMVNALPLIDAITVGEAATEEPTPTPTAEPTPTPTAEPTLIPTAAPTEAPADVVYINETFTYDDRLIIKSVGSDVTTAPDPVELGDIIYMAGRRANSNFINNTANIAGNTLVINADSYSTSGRGVTFTFADGKIPMVSELASGKVLEMSFDVQTNSTFTVVNYGQLTTSDLTTGSVHARIILDKDANKQYLIVTDAEGKVINTKTAALSMQTFAGMSFRDGAAKVTIDNLKVEAKAKDVGVASFTVKDKNNAAVSDAAITIGSYSVVTDANGAATAVLPNGTYTAEASKSGYEHTTGMLDNDSASVTVASDSTSYDFTLSLSSYDKIPETVTIENGQSFIAAPKSAATVSTAAFTVSVLDQFDIKVEDSSEYNLAWAIYPAGTTTADGYVSISDSGIVTVSKDFTTDNSVKAYDVTATVVMNNAGLRGQTVTKTLYIGNNDVVYYEPVEWSTTSRDETKNIISSVAMPEVSSITVDLNFKALSRQHRTVALMTDAGALVGVQLQGSSTSNSKTIKAWTGSKQSNNQWNQWSFVDNFDNSFVLAENYSIGTEIPVTFVIDRKNKVVNVSCGDKQDSLPFTIDPKNFTGFRTAECDLSASFVMNAVTVVEPDPNYLSIAGDKDFAKVSGKTITRNYTLNRSVVVPGETFDWSVSPTGKGVTVDNGILSVEDTATAGNYTLTATSTSNAAKTSTVNIEIGGFQTISQANATIEGANTYGGIGQTGAYRITRLIDSYGDDVTALLPAAVWTSDNASVVTITEDGELTVTGKGTARLTATITNGSAVSTFTVPITVDIYFITADATGNSTAVDTSELITKTTDSSITGYQVTTSKAGKLVNQTVVTTAPTTVETTGADKLEIAPVFTVTNVTGSSSKTVSVPADTYNFNITAASGTHFDPYVNDQMLANNMLQGGSTVNYIAVNDIVVNEGYATLNLRDYASNSKAGKITIVKSPSIVDRTKKVYVLGDSLVCIYANGGDATHNYQTGWGQVLGSYLTDDYEVVDLGNSGVIAEGLADSAITQVAISGKSGDIMLLESGYNDRSRSTQDKMKAAVTSMYNAAKAKDVDVVMLSPNASQHDYKSSVSWGGVMGTVANETGAKYIDLAALSYNFLYGKYGSDTDAVKASYNVSDGLHANYNGANKFASIVAGGMIDVGLGSAVNTSYKYTFKDSLGQTITCQASN